MVGITATWGTCFLAIHWGLRDAPVFWFASLRALVAGAALLLVVITRGHPLPRGRSAWALIGLLAIVNVAVAFAAMFAGVDGGPTGTAAVLANAQPLLILVPAWLLYGEAVSATTALGMALGFSGLILVAAPNGDRAGATVSLLAALAITGGTLLARRVARADVISVCAWQFAIGGLVLAGFAGAVEGAPEIDWTPRFVASLAFLGIIGTAVAFVAWFVEAQRCRLDQLTAWTFLVPVVGITIGVLVLGERPRGMTIVGLVTTLAAMWVVLRPRHRS